MKDISTVQVVDTLAEITRQHDRGLLERSLTATLAELMPTLKFSLYRVAAVKPRLTLAQVATVCEGVVVPDQEAYGANFTGELLAAIGEAVATASVIQTEDPGAAEQHVVYPVSDNEHAVIEILVQTGARPSQEDRRFTHALLRVYSNYLMLLEESQHDKLTQLMNRETLDREITKIIIANGKLRGSSQPHELQRASDQERHWLCVIDLDHFKRINDRFGHLYGDEVLILFARLMESVFRVSDRLFRYGGEEFIALFKTRSREDARSVCERLRTTVEKHRFPRVDRVTVSIGVVEITDQCGTSGAIDQADRALYYSKEHGRNQVNCYRQLLADGLLKEGTVDKGGAVDFF